MLDDSEELQQRAAFASAPLPTSIAGFKNHPFYALAKQMGSTQALDPSQRPIAYFKGEAVYPRDSVGDLYSTTQWRKRCRVVREGEQPHRITRRKVFSGGTGDGYRDMDDNSNGQGNGASPTHIDIALFGLWQTDRFQPAIAVDGYIPINEHGNVEVWGHNLGLLPIGTALVTGVTALQAARELGIPFAPALADFETRGGHRVPVIDGVAVFQDFEEIVREAAIALEDQRIEKFNNKKEFIITGRWVKLVKSLLNRQKLREAYGH